MVKVKNNKLFISLISVFILLLVDGCNESGSNITGGGITDTAVIEASKVISFIPEGSPGENSVYLEKESVSNNEISFKVKIKSGENVYGSSIEIKYDGSKISYVSTIKGDYLGERNETFFYAELNKGLEGTLLIGTSRIGNAVGVNGDGTLFTIIFRIRDIQKDVVLEFNKSSSVLKSPAGNIYGTGWFGGILGLR